MCKRKWREMDSGRQGGMESYPEAEFSESCPLKVPEKDICSLSGECSPFH